MLTHLLSRTMTRRQAILATAGASLLTLGPGARLVASAQGAGDLATLSYPKLSLTVTDTAIDGVPATTAAGLTRGIACGVARRFTGVDRGTSRCGAGRAAGLHLPIALRRRRLRAARHDRRGRDRSAARRLDRLGDDPTAGQKPVAFTVTGDFQPDVKDPQADITATLVDFAITIEGNPTAGTHILKVVSHGAEPHSLEVDKGPDTMTKELVGAALRSQMNGTPEPGGFANATLEPAFYTPIQSIGTTTWHAIDLKPGSYLAACFFPTAGTGVPHAMNGMFDVFKVTG